MTPTAHNGNRKLFQVRKVDEDCSQCCEVLLIAELSRIAVSNVGRDEEVRRGGGGGGRSGRRDEPRRHTLSGDHHHHQQGGALARSMDLEVSVIPVLHVHKMVPLHVEG